MAGLRESVDSLGTCELRVTGWEQEGLQRPLGTRDEYREEGPSGDILVKRRPLQYGAAGSAGQTQLRTGPATGRRMPWALGAQPAPGSAERGGGHISWPLFLAFLPGPGLHALPSQLPGPPRGGHTACVGADVLASCPSLPASRLASREAETLDGNLWASPRGKLSLAWLRPPSLGRAPYSSICGERKGCRVPAEPCLLEGSRLECMHWKRA